MTVAVAAVAVAPVLTVSDVVVGGGPGSDDVIDGTGGGDELYGGGGGDIIHGKAGDDVIYGDATAPASGHGQGSGSGRGHGHGSGSGRGHGQGSGDGQGHGQGSGGGWDGGGGAGIVVPLDIQASLQEQDPTQTLDITVAGVPEDAVLSAGTDLGDGTWALTGDDLDGLTMSLPEDHAGPFDLSVTATVTEIDPDSGAINTAFDTATINVGFAGDIPGDDQLFGGAGDDVIYGGGGDDLVRGDAGDDVLYGDQGADDLRGGGGEDVLHGGAGDDLLRGGGGGDVLYGDAGDDVLRGEGGDDVLAGGAGDDVLVGGGGRDAFMFGIDGGSDTIQDYKLGEELRFEGPEFSGSEPVVQQNDNGVTIMFGDQNVQVEVNDVDLSQQSYTITQEPDALILTFEDQK